MYDIIIEHNSHDYNREIDDLWKGSFRNVRAFMRITQLLERIGNRENLGF